MIIGGRKHVFILPNQYFLRFVAIYFNKCIIFVHELRS